LANQIFHHGGELGGARCFQRETKSRERGGMGRGVRLRLGRGRRRSLLQAETRGRGGRSWVRGWRFQAEKERGKRAGGWGKRELTGGPGLSAGERDGGKEGAGWAAAQEEGRGRGGFGPKRPNGEKRRGRFQLPFIFLYQNSK